MRKLSFLNLLLFLKKNREKFLSLQIINSFGENKECAGTVIEKKKRLKERKKSPRPKINFSHTIKLDAFYPCYTPLRWRWQHVTLARTTRSVYIYNAYTSFSVCCAGEFEKFSATSLAIIISQHLREMIILIVLRASETVKSYIIIHPPLAVLLSSRTDFPIFV